MNTPDLLPVLTKRLGVLAEPQQLHPMLLENAWFGHLTGFSTREKELSVTLDAFPPYTAGYSLGMRAIVVILPDAASSAADTPDPCCQ
jgi:hypothetical protein